MKETAREDIHFWHSYKSTKMAMLHYLLVALLLVPLLEAAGPRKVFGEHIIKKENERYIYKRAKSRQITTSKEKCNDLEWR